MCSCCNCYCFMLLNLFRHDIISLRLNFCEVMTQVVPASSSANMSLPRTLSTLCSFHRSWSVRKQSTTLLHTIVAFVDPDITMCARIVNILTHDT